MHILVIPRTFRFGQPPPGRKYRWSRVFKGDPAFFWVDAWYAGERLRDQNRERDIPVPWDFPVGVVKAVAAGGRSLLSDSTGWLYTLDAFSPPTGGPVSIFYWPK